jgi:hypothetical protein
VYIRNVQRPSSQTVAILLSLLAAAVVVWSFAARTAAVRTVDAGFWFEEITFANPLLTPPLTSDELEIIQSVARLELTRAFAGLRIRISDRQDARYRVRVVPDLQDLRFKRAVGIAGESRAIAGFGGSGAVSFWFLANGAIAHAPAAADRRTVVEAIGRGIGRTAVHELTHQLLPKAPIHDSTNTASYEYPFAARREHYYGEVQWDFARPLLAGRLGQVDGVE